MAEPIYDKKDQLETVQAMLLDGETIEAVFDCKGAMTGFIGITNKRVTYFHKSLMGKHKAIVSLPHSHIVLVAAEGDRGIFGSTSMLFLTESSGTTIEFDFRGGDKAKLAHTLLLKHLLAMPSKIALTI